MLSPASPAAARLHYRRRAQLIFPWGLLLCALSVSLYSVWSRPISLPGFVWGLFVGACCLVYEMVTPHSRIVRYAYLALNHIFRERFTKPALDTLDEVYSLYPTTPLFEHRHTLRWLSAFLITASTWVLIPLSRHSSFLPGLLALYSVLPFSVLALEALRNVAWGQKVGFWIALIVLGGVSVGAGVFRLAQDWFGWLVYVLIACFIYVGSYMNQRLWTDARVTSDLIRQIATTMLTYTNVPQALENEIPAQIGKWLRYDRVAILLKDITQSQLTMTGLYGDLPQSLIGTKIERSRGGLTWRAVERKKAIAWNDVRWCPYYLSLHENRAVDNTRAEIAVPIAHHGSVYGVLDVQSNRAGIYGWRDRRILETIAQIIGVAIASHRDERLLSQAGELWNQLTLSISSSEAELFEIFARFASQHLGTDIFVYYPLSPTGFPDVKPFFHGVKFPEYLHEGITNYASPLIQLIQDWKHHPSPDVLTDPIYVNPQTNQPSPFSLREDIKSNYFVPVGVKQEPLGALFLNFTELTKFDNLFVLMVHSFSQAFATIAWKNRYRKLIYESFGSPAYDVHYKRGLYGLKAGVSKEIEDCTLSVEDGTVARVNLDVLKSLTGRVDRFLDEIQFEEELVPPDFWDPNISLERELVDFINSRPLLPKQNRYPDVSLSLDYRIERENPIVKLALYRVISEAINNAIVHGEASDIRVQVNRRPTCIDIVVNNDGLPLPDDYQERRALVSKGILYLFEKLEEGFGASTSIQTGEGGKGTTVQISIPSLPA